jgi:hypothetical protein
METVANGGIDAIGGNWARLLAFTNVPDGRQGKWRNFIAQWVPMWLIIGV